MSEAITRSTLDRPLLKRYQQVREQSLKICQPLEKEDYVVQPIIDVSPPKWHLAHTTWFFETFILRKLSEGYQLFDSQFPYLFNSYYVTAGDRWVRAERGHLTRPTVSEIYSYRQYVDDHMENLLSKYEPESEEERYLFEIGMQHEQQHQELLMYDIKYILGNNPIFPCYKEAPVINNQHQDRDWTTIPEGTYQIGFDGKGFCFDNEKGVHQVHLPGVRIASTLVSNTEYLEFMKDGGYREPTLWLAEGWDWVNANNIDSPMYWNHLDGDWMQYSLSGFKMLDPFEPLSHISFFEADAFARWAGRRLPTEFEWEVACKTESRNEDKSNFLEDDHLNPLSPGNQYFGNLWEWTESAYRPYPYYRPKPGTLGEYNGKFMINQMVLRGGSYGTPRDHIRATYRNFFHPHMRWMFSGIRLAEHI